jgi:hypothetical protein
MAEPSMVASAVSRIFARVNPNKKCNYSGSQKSEFRRQHENAGDENLGLVEAYSQGILNSDS